uniref:Zinc knuckle CX2CX4HX4C n=1 Tax=Tanacetum cinerariifolium TaxID=118510 RepID=A0A6L2LHG6_TANCI|nr:hypothetical protein [Tanacetum cinerariifolium]
MEAGFLLGNKSPKKSGLAAKVKNIEGKLLGKDDKPLKSCLKMVSSKTIQGNPAGKMGSHSMDSVTNTSLNTNPKKPTIAATITAANADVNAFRDQPRKVHVSAMINDVKVQGANVAIPIVGCNSYARVLVKLSFECDIKETIVVAIPLHKGNEHYLEELDVEYEWWPPRCSKCKIFDHDDDGCPSRVRKAGSDFLSRERVVREASNHNKKKGVKKADKRQGFKVTNPKNLIYRPATKPNATNENTSTSNNLLSSKEVVNGAAKPIVSHELKSNMKNLMDEDKVLELNSNNVMERVVDKVHSDPDNNKLSTTFKSLPMEVKGNDNGSLWEQFNKSRNASTSKQNSISDTDSSEVEEVCMTYGILGGGFIDDMEDDLYRYDGYEAQVYDLTEEEQAFCDWYDIRLNSRCRK